MKRKLGHLILAGLTAAIVSACATQGAPPPAFDTHPIAAGKWNQKADHLYFILDASSSMDERYKLETARGVIAHFNQTMPHLNLVVALRSFGHDPIVSGKLSDLMVSPQAYAPGLLVDGLAKVSKAGGFSPLERALGDTAADLKNVNGPIALIIVSDGKDMGVAPLAAARALAAAHANRLCIYTVLVGSAPDGQMLLFRISRITGCGQAVTADNLATGAAMNAFVQEVLLAGMADSDGDGIADDKDTCPKTPAGVKVDEAGCPLDSDGDGIADDKDICPKTPAGVKVDEAGCPLDSDGDGVADDQDSCPDTPAGLKVDRAGCPIDSDRDGVLDDHDQCPDTPKGTKVNIKGCPIPMAALGPVTAGGTYVFKDIKFETNKSDLKSRSYPTLNKIAEALRASPGLNVEIQGHTDNRGSHDDNVNLSQRRAESVKAYLVSQGIDGERLAARGYGPDRPMATNKTAQGRASNRRVEIKPLQ